MGDALAIVGNLAEVQRLVEQDRGLLNENDGTYTPLTAAACLGRVEVVRYLLEEGAQANLRDPNDDCALNAACARGNREMVGLLLAHGADATAGLMGVTPLMAASDEGHTDVVALLLAHGCGDIDLQRPGSRWTALCDAVYRGHAGVVRALLGARADPQVMVDHGETPLAMSVRRGHTECVALLQVSSSMRLTSRSVGPHIRRCCRTGFA
jgi:ankyrin repeat protein